MLPLAFMAQYVWEVGGGVLASLVMGQGLLLLARPDAVPDTRSWNPRPVCVLGCLFVLAGVGIGLAALLLEAEQPGRHSRDHWGGAAGIAILAVWVGLMIGITALQHRNVKPRRR
jgi:hypothetical protein